MHEEKLIRWERWLDRSFPPSHLARGRVPGPARSEDAVWHVEFQDGKLGRIHVEPRAVDLTEEEFLRVVRTLERTDWYAHLDRLLRIRIRRDGSVGAVRD